jgi:hypothetical protein
MWKEINSNIKTFQFGEEPEIIYIIKTGHENLYIVVHDDAYQYFTGRTELCSKEEIKNKLSIDMNDIELREKFTSNIDGSKEFYKSVKIDLIEMLVNNHPNDQDLGREIRRFITIKERINGQES